VNNEKVPNVGVTNSYAFMVYKMRA